MYLEYYHLGQKPFQINTDPAFLWFGEKHKEALATLKYGLLENKSFLLLTGDVGVGKTTTVNALLKALDKDCLVAVINDPKLDKLDFFMHIAHGFGLAEDFTTKGRFLIAFWKFLLEQHYRGKRLLLIVDECQLLSHELLEEIRLLSNLENNGTKLINIFFVGQLEFNAILLLPENKAIRQRMTVNYNIPPLSRDETEKYIEYRMSVAGANRKIFDKSAIREIYQFTNGYPRVINVICDRALLTGFISSSQQINKKIIQECITELDISLATEANLPSRKEEKPADNSRTRPYWPWRYLTYAMTGLVLIILLYSVSGSSWLSLPPFMSKLQSIMPGIISQQQAIDVMPDIAQAVIMPASAGPDAAVVPVSQPAILPESPPAILPEPSPAILPESPPAQVQPEAPPPINHLVTEDPSADNALSAPNEYDESQDPKQPLEILVISFEHDSLDVSPSSFTELEKLAEAVLDRDTASILIRGYTDASGHPQYNKKLAGFRATSVKNILAGKGVPLEKIDIASYADADTQDQRTRRVEVEVLD